MLEQPALDFFRRWSRFVCKYPKFRTRGEPLASQEREALRLELSKLSGSTEVSKENLDEAEEIAKEMANDAAKEDYDQLRESQPRYRDKEEAYPLLQNNDLWDLMRIPFSASVAATAASERSATDAIQDSGAALAGASPRPAGPAQKVAVPEFVRKKPRAVQSAVAASLDQRVDQVTANDLLFVRIIDLYDAEVSDISALAKLLNLRKLDLDGTQVIDLSPLANLLKLESLDLRNTKVSDVSALANLQNLHTLYLGRTHVTDLSPLAGLQNLRRLDLRNTHVRDVSPLVNLQRLQKLYLTATEVSDVSPLANLQTIQVLHLGGTHVSDVSPLANVQDLRELDLQNETEVNDILPLANLQNLRLLCLWQTPVSDEQISRFKKLQPGVVILAGPVTRILAVSRQAASG